MAQRGSIEQDAGTSAGTAAARGSGMDEHVRALAKQLLDGGLNDLSARERRVIERIAQRHHVSRNLNRAFEERSTIGERLADRVATIGGSWGFVTGFGLFLIAWAVLNTEILGRWNDAFDPYPYVFLNLILSMLAAIQAPIIMMSQNRQAAKDRFAAGLDYEVNLKTELEIMSLHDKLNGVLAAHLAEVSQTQRELTTLVHRLIDGRITSKGLDDGESDVGPR